MSRPDPPPGDEARQVEHPVAVRGQVQVVGTGLANCGDDALVARPSRFGGAGPQPAGAGLYVQVPTGFDVDDAEHAYRRELQLARIGDVHGDDAMPQREAVQSISPAGSVEEVRCDDDLPAVVLRA